MPMEPLRILYEDAHLVLCVKPVGVLLKSLTVYLN